jgi:hypothetical protein
MANILSTPPVPGFKRPICNHSKAKWGQIQVEYMGDGTAVVWQTGQCNECASRLVKEYSGQDAKAA